MSRLRNGMNSMMGEWATATAAIVMVLLGGCESSSGLDMLELPAARYHAAFDAAVDAARSHGMPATLRDRRGGIIETEARIAGSILEPWRTDNASLDQAMENTLALQRRRARFEFMPAGFQPQREPDAGDPTAPPLIDLTAHEGDLALRVWVFVERAHNAGLRRSTWTRSKTSVSQLTVPEGEAGMPQGQFWTPVTRDLEYERRLLEAVREAMEPGSSAQ